MKVLHAEISEGTKNKRTRRTTGLKGCVITFESVDNLAIDSVVSVLFEGETYHFQIREASTTDSTKLELCALEYGYYAKKLDRKEGFDPRDLLGCGVDIVTDEKKLSHLRESSCWC